MEIVSRPTRFGGHHNAFGFLRLLLASLVIVSHTPEIIDGDRRRELLTLLFGSISFGEAAVDGFFLISGFLITGSVMTSASSWSYLKKRLVRIYPAFAVASVICVTIVGPLSGAYSGHGPLRSIAGMLFRILILCPPTLVDPFHGTYYRDLNGVMWTIQYEFLCYLLILGLRKAGLLRSAWWTGSGALALLLGYIVLLETLPDPMVSFTNTELFLRQPGIEGLRLLGCFLCGATYYLAQRRLVFSVGLAIAAAVGFVVLMSFAATAHLGFAIFGGYLLLFVAAGGGGGTWLARVNNRVDISYGVYLYAYPIQKLLLWYHVVDDIWLVGIVTWLLAALCGTMSWFVVERPSLRWARARTRGSSTA